MFNNFDNKDRPDQKQYQSSAKRFGSDIRQFLSGLSKSDITSGEAGIIENLSFRFSFVKDLISVLQYSKSMVIPVGKPEIRAKGFRRARIALEIGTNSLIYNYHLANGDLIDLGRSIQEDCPSCGLTSEIISFCNDEIVFGKNKIIPKKLICSNCLCYWKYTLLKD